MQRLLTLRRQEYKLKHHFMEQAALPRDSTPVYTPVLETLSHKFIGQHIVVVMEVVLVTAKTETGPNVHQSKM